MSFLIVESISEYILYSSNTFYNNNDFYGKTPVDYGCVERDAEIEKNSNIIMSLYNTVPLVAVVGASSRSLLNAIAPRLGAKNGEQWMKEEEYLACTNQSQAHLLSKIYGCVTTSNIDIARKREHHNGNCNNNNNNQRKQFSNFTTEEEAKILAEVEAKTPQNHLQQQEAVNGNNNSNYENVDHSAGAAASSSVSGFGRLDPFSRDFYEPYVVSCDEKLLSIFVNFADSFIYATKLALSGSSPVKPHEYQLNGARQKCQMIKERQENKQHQHNQDNNDNQHDDEYLEEDDDDDQQTSFTFPLAWKPPESSASSSKKKISSTEKFLSSLNEIERKVLAKCSGNLHSLTFRPPQFAKVALNPPPEVNSWFSAPSASSAETKAPHFEVDDFFPIITGTQVNENNNNNNTTTSFALRLLESVTLDTFRLVHRPYLFCHCSDGKEEKETNNINKESGGKDVFDIFRNGNNNDPSENGSSNNVNSNAWEDEDPCGKTNYVIYFDLFYLIKRLSFVTQDFSPVPHFVTFSPLPSSAVDHVDGSTHLLDEEKIFPQPLPSLRKLDLHDIQVCRPTNSGLPHPSQEIPISRLFSSGQNLSRLKYLRHLRMSNCGLARDREKNGADDYKFPSTVFRSDSIESEIYWNQITPEAQKVRKQRNNNHEETICTSQESSSSTVMQHIDAYNSQKFCFKLVEAAFPPLRRINFWKSREETFKQGNNDDHDDDENDVGVIINSLSDENNFLDAVLEHDGDHVSGSSHFQSAMSFSWAKSMLNHNHLPPNLFSLDLSNNTIVFIDFEDFPQSLKNSLVLMNFSRCSLENASYLTKVTRSGNQERKSGNNNKKKYLSSLLLSSRENYYFDFHVFSDFYSLRELNLSHNTSLQFPKNSDLGALPDSLQFLDVRGTTFNGRPRVGNNDEQSNTERQQQTDFVDDDEAGPDFTSLPTNLRILQMSDVKASGRIDLRNLPPNLEVLEIGLNDLQFTKEIERLAEDDDENNNNSEIQITRNQHKPIVKLPDTMHFISLFRNKFKGNLQKLFFCDQEWTNSRSNLRLLSMSANHFSGSIFPLPFLLEKVNLADNEKLSTPSELEGLDCARFPRYADYINLYNCPNLRGPLRNLHLLPPECQVFGIRGAPLLTLLPPKDDDEEQRNEAVLDLSLLPRKMLQLSLTGCSNLEGRLILRNSNSGQMTSLPPALSRLLLDGCNFSGEIDFSNSLPRGMAQVRFHNNKNLRGKLSMEHFRNRKLSHLTEFSIYGCDFEGEIDLDELFSQNCCPKLLDQFKWKDEHEDEDEEKNKHSKLNVIANNKKEKEKIL